MDEEIYSEKECAKVGRLVLQIAHALSNGDFSRSVFSQQLILHDGSQTTIEISQPYFVLTDEKGNIHRHYSPRKEAKFYKKKKP